MVLHLELSLQQSKDSFTIDTWHSNEVEHSGIFFVGTFVGSNEIVPLFLLGVSKNRERDIGRGLIYMGTDARVDN